VWELGGCANKEVLDYSTPTTNGTPEAALSEDINLVRCIKVRVKITIGQKLGRKHLEGISGFERGMNYMWVFLRSQIMLPGYILGSSPQLLVFLITPLFFACVL
jgi:hypothetical protein